MTKSQDRRKARMWDIRMFIQLIMIISGVISVYYISQIDAAVNENILTTHVGNTALHPEFKILTEQFVPRNEVQIQLNNINTYLKNIDNKMGKFESALIQIRNKME